MHSCPCWSILLFFSTSSGRMPSRNQPPPLPRKWGQVQLDRCGCWGHPAPALPWTWGMSGTGNHCWGHCRAWLHTSGWCSRVAASGFQWLWAEHHCSENLWSYPGAYITTKQTNWVCVTEIHGLTTVSLAFIVEESPGKGIGYAISSTIAEWLNSELYFLFQGLWVRYCI